MVSVSDISNAKAARLTLVAFIHFLNFWLFCNTAVLLRLHCILAVSYVSWIRYIMMPAWGDNHQTVSQFDTLASSQTPERRRRQGISWQTSVSMSRNAINFWSSLRWAGKDCWQPCGNVSGDCAWCGAGNACCRFNAEHDPDECTGVRGKEILTGQTWLWEFENDHVIHYFTNRTEFQIQMGLNSNLSLLLQDSMARIRRLKFEFKPLDLLA